VSTAIKEQPTLAQIPSFVPIYSLIRTLDTGNTYIGTGENSPSVTLFASPDVPGGFAGDLQYNNGSGAFGGSAATIDAAGNLTLPASVIDGSASTGTNGQVLSSTVTGVKWVAASVGGPASLLLAVTSKAGNYKPGATDQVVLFSATATATLDSTLQTGTTFILKNTSAAGTLTVQPSAGTLDGQSSWALSTLESINVVYDGGNWWTI
jgi:hypothetical protein